MTKFVFQVFFLFYMYNIYHLILSGNFQGSEIQHGIFLVKFLVPSPFPPPPPPPPPLAPFGDKKNKSSNSSNFWSRFFFFFGGGGGGALIFAPHLIISSLEIWSSPWAGFVNVGFGALGNELPTCHDTSSNQETMPQT